MSILLGITALQRGPTRPDINDLHAGDAFCSASLAPCGTLNGAQTHISTVYFYKVPIQRFDRHARSDNSEQDGYQLLTIA